METLLWDVDTQIDFMDEDGKLAVKGASNIRQNLERITEFARQENITRWGSLDYHEESDEEISDDPDFENTFPPHCLANTDGWNKIPETEPEDPLYIDSEPRDPEEVRSEVQDHPNDIFFRKQKFNVFSNPNLDTALEAVDVFQIALFGVTLDVCVRHAVKGFLERDYQVTVIEDATRALEENQRDELLFRWKNLGAQVIGTEEAISGYVL